MYFKVNYLFPNLLCVILILGNIISENKNNQIHCS